MKLSDLARGLPGHPTHPPLTDATIGVYTFAAIAALMSVLDIEAGRAAQGWSLAIIIALILTAPTAFVGLLDWAKLANGTPMWRTATLHLGVMVAASVLFIIAAVLGYGDARDGVLPGSAAAMTFVGFAVLAAGGWIGGSIVYVHGMRVLNLPEEPTHRAVSPAPHPEKEDASRL